MVFRKRRLLSFLVIAALLVGLAGTAVAGFPDVSGTRFQDSADYLKSLGVVVGDPDGNFYPARNISRAEAAKIIINIVGRGDQVNALVGVAAFSDTAAHWASGYIALARNLGIVNGFPDGTFRPDEFVTYVQMAKMLLEAAGVGPDPTFMWPANYMTVAQVKGLFTGLPAYSADVRAIRGDCGLMTAHAVRNVLNPLTARTLAQSVFAGVASLALTPSSPSSPAGAAVQFTATPRDAAGNPISGLPVAFTTNDQLNAVVGQSGLFNSAVPGAYIVSATTAGLTTQATVSVYGASARLKVTPSATQVTATGISRVTVTVEVVDAIGNRVTNNSTAVVTMAYASGGSNGAVTLGASTKTVAAGTTQFELTATTNGARTDTLAFSSTGLSAASLAITSVDQVATSVRVVATPDMVRTNSPTSTAVVATVLDQSGTTMAGGLVAVTFTLSGPGTFAGGLVTPRAVLTIAGEAVVDVYSVQGLNGTIGVTARAPGLASGQVSIVSYLAGSASGLSALVTDDTIAATEVGAGANSAVLKVRLIDSDGRPTTRSALTLINIALANGDALSTVGLVVIGDTTIPADATESAILTIRAVNTSSGVAGMHNLKVVATGDSLSAVSFAVVVGPGAAHSLSVAPAGNVWLPIGNPVATATVQMMDAAGNKVATSGTTVTAGWSDPGTVNVGKPAINGTLNPPADPASLTAVSSQTDASGLATFSFAAQPYVGDDYVLAFRAGGLVQATGTLKVASQVASQIDVEFIDADSAATITQLKADYSEVGALLMTVRDGAGNPLGGWYVEVSFPSEGVNVKNLSLALGSTVVPLVGGRTVVRTYNNPGSPDHGSIGFLFRAAKAATFTVSAKALELAQPVVGSGSFKTMVGTAVAGVIVTTDTGGSPASLSVAANVPVGLRLVATDNGGNPSTPMVDVAVLVDQIEGLYSTGANGRFRLEASGVDIPAGGYVTITRGTTSKTIYYVQPLAQSDIDIGIDAGNTAYVAYVIAQHSATSITGGYLLTYDVTDGSGNPAPGVKVWLYPSAGLLNGTDEAITLTTNISGQVSVSWTGGSGGQVNVTLVNAVLGDGVSRVEMITPFPIP